MSKTLKASICYMIALLSFITIRILSCYGVFSSFKGFLGDLEITILIQIVCLILLPFSFYRLTTNENLRTTLKNFGYKKIKLNTIFLCVILGVIAFLFNMCISSIWNFLLALFGYSSRGSSNTLVYTNIVQLIISLISTAVLPGFCEEFLHRGLFQSLLKEEKSYVFSVIITGVLFGLFHLNIYQTGYATFMGIFMGFLVVYSGSIFTAVIIHFMNNALNVFINFLNDLSPSIKNMFSSLENLRTPSSIYGTIIFVVIFVIVALLLCYLTYRIFIKIIKNEKLQDCKYTSKEIALCIMFFNKNDFKKINDENFKQKVVDIKNLFCLTYPLNNKKLEFKDYILLITIIFLSTIITIFTFIWGII